MAKKRKNKQTKTVQKLRQDTGGIKASQSFPSINAFQDFEKGDQLQDDIGRTSFLTKKSTEIDQEFIASLPFINGAMDYFVPPNIFSGWAYYKKDISLNIRIFANSSILGEVSANRPRSDLTTFNNGLVGWKLEINDYLSVQEFLKLSDSISILAFDENENIIGKVAIWNKLLEKLANGL